MKKFSFLLWGAFHKIRNEMLLYPVLSVTVTRQTLHFAEVIESQRKIAKIRNK